MDRFEPFGLLHLTSVVACVAGWAWLVRIFRAARGTPRERARRIALGVAVIAFNVAWTAYRFTPAYFDIDASLPLHACDFAWIAGASAILRTVPPDSPDSHDRIDRQIAFYWGIGLAPLGVITPVLTDGPSDVDFWAFWLRHFLIPACALVDSLALGLRPTRKGLFASLGVTVALLVPITALNVKLGTSYFFTGPAQTENPTPIDWLGPWPLRIAWIAALGAGWFALLFAAFRVRPRPRPRKTAAPSPPGP